MNAHAADAGCRGVAERLPVQAGPGCCMINSSAGAGAHRPTTPTGDCVALPDCRQAMDDLMDGRAESFAAVLVPFCASLANAQECAPATS